MQFSGRFTHGFCPETGKKADLMFAQHMLAVLKTDGMMATVMPHGVLFRGGEEKKIRESFIKNDHLEAVIGLPPNLFYGTGIPACILIMRPVGAKPAERQGKVLFINADAEYYAGRAQNYLRPEHIEKITWVFEKFESFPGYSAVVSTEELADNDYNCNIRRYADNAPPPEPQDVRAHISGGIPKAEVEAKRHLLVAHGFDPTRILVEHRSVDYLDFVPAITERGQIKPFIESDTGIQEQEGKLYSVFAAWWQLHARGLSELPKTKKVMELRAEFLSSFVDSLETVGLLDRFKVAGVVASWWDEVKYELRTLSESDFGGLVDSWVDTIRDALEQDDEDKKNQPVFDPLNHKLVVRLMPNYLEEIAEAEAAIAELEQQKEAFERGEEAEAEEGEATEEDSEQVNFAKELDTRLKTLKNSIKEPKKEIKILKKTPLLNGDKIVELEAEVESIEAEIAEIERQLEPYKEIKKQLAEAKAKLRTLKNELVKRLLSARAALTDEECQGLVLAIFKDGLIAELERYVIAHRQQANAQSARFANAAVENWWDKYRVTLQHIEAKRDEAAKRLSEFLQGLGYV